MQMVTKSILLSIRLAVVWGDKYQAYTTMALQSLLNVTVRGGHGRLERIVGRLAREEAPDFGGAIEVGSGSPQ
jgi:hypothetical protein